MEAEAFAGGVGGVALPALFSLDLCAFARLFELVLEPLRGGLRRPERVPKARAPACASLGAAWCPRSGSRSRGAEAPFDGASERRQTQEPGPTCTRRGLETHPGRLDLARELKFT